MTSIWPTINAGFNLIGFLCLLSGYRFIKRGEREKHRFSMVGALVASSLFLASYLAYHFNAGSKSFEGEGVARTVYFLILISHSVLAVGVAPLIIMTFARALKGDFEKHRAVAHWTLPLWLYVSFTGVAVYLMLYVF